jgi:hypothetical protein
VLEVPGKGRVLVFSYASPTSGVPWKWAATAHRPFTKKENFSQTKTRA